MHNSVYHYSGFTPGCNLNTVVTGDELLKGLTSYCRKNKCYPVIVQSAEYDWMRVNGFMQTQHEVYIECVPGITSQTVKDWLKHTKINWVFGLNNQDALKDG